MPAKKKKVVAYPRDVEFRRRSHCTVMIEGRIYRVSVGPKGLSFRRRHARRRGYGQPVLLLWADMFGEAKLLDTQGLDGRPLLKGAAHEPE